MANCPYCNRYFNKKDLAVEHISRYHSNRLEMDQMDPCQALYFGTHGSLHGHCLCGCSTPTEWNYKTGKPHKVSPDPKCRERLRALASKNMMRVYGKTTLLDDMEHQKDMQEHRRIAGSYKFSDGGEVEYLGQLEKNFLMFCDKVMELTSNMFLDPPENFKYHDPKDGKDHTYMPDYYLPDYNLLVEIKDGGDHPNTNPAFVKETRYKVSLKDEVMKKQTKYNYIRISGKNYTAFVETLYSIVHGDIPDMNDGKKRKNLVVITESATTDIDEIINLMTAEGDYREMYLLVAHYVGQSFPMAVAVSANPYFAKLYLTDYTKNELRETTGDDDILGGCVIETYRCVVDPDQIATAMQRIIQVAGEDAGIWDVVDILGDFGIYFSSPKSGFDKWNRRMDFIRTGTYSNPYLTPKPNKEVTDNAQE